MKTYKRNKRNCPIGQGYSCCLDYYDEDRRVAGADQIPADTRDGLASTPTAARDQASETGARTAPAASARPIREPIHYVELTREPAYAL